MRSLYVRILFALLATILASLVAFLAVFLATSRPGQQRLIRDFQARQLEDAVAAFERGGAPAAGAFLDRLSGDLAARHFLLDRNGRDLVSGEDRSIYLKAPGPPFGGPHDVDGRLVVVEPRGDAQYHLLVFVPPPFDLPSVLPYYALIVVAVALLCWLLVLTIVSPIRQLAAAVDRFGRGELTTRVSAQRRDEIGNLGRAFNTMAERI